MKITTIITSLLASAIVANAAEELKSLQFGAPADYRLWSYTVT